MLLYFLYDLVQEEECIDRFPARKEMREFGRPRRLVVLVLPLLFSVAGDGESRVGQTMH